MAMWTGFVWTFALAVSAAMAQSATEAGIRAMLRGDYPNAIRILRPLANDDAHPDPVAQFFLALAYESGLADGGRTRACGLFLRVAGQAGPFAEQSAALASAIRRELGEPGAQMCVADGGWQGGPPQSFPLGPGRGITFTDQGVTLKYGDQEQRTDMFLPPAAELKIEYTPLDVTRPVAARREFFQWVGWLPENRTSPSSWKLVWVLSEVVGDHWIQIATDTSVAVANGPTRPASTDASKLIQLRVNAKGEAEYEVTAGPAPRTVPVAWQGGR